MRSIRLHLTIPDRPAAAVFTTLAAADNVGGSGPSGTTMVSQWALTGPGFPPLDGALTRFDGSWSCVDDGADTALTFAARLDMGVSEPMAARTLVDDTVATVAGLFEGNVRVDDVVIQTHQAANLPAA